MHPLIFETAIDSVEALRFTLQSYTRPLHTPRLAELLSRVQLRRDHLEPWLRFSEDGLQRVNMFRSDVLQVDCVGWKPGQSVTVHRPRQYSCCMLVVEGAMMHADYQLRPTGGWELIDEQWVHPGDLVTNDRRHCYRCENPLEADQTLVTLNCYSPPA